MIPTPTLLIRDGAVLTMDAQDTVYNPGWVAIKDGRIAALGPGCPPAERDTPTDAVLTGAARVIDASGMAVLPGMVNGHTHLEQIFMRGLAEGLPLIRWLKEAMWPLEGAMTPEEMYLAARLSLLEYLHCGITAVVQHHKVTRSPEHLDAAARAAEEMGMRLLLARLWADVGTPSETLDRTLAEMERLRARWHGAAGGRITVGFGPAVLWRCSEAALRCTVAQARVWGLPTHIHVAEGRDEVAMLRERVGMGNIEWMDSLGALGPDVHLAHSIWVSDAELDMIARSGAVVVHCPTSNLYLGSGIAPVRKMLDRGIPVTLGTDGAGGGGSQDMLQTAKLAALLAKVSTGDPNAVLPMTVLRMATANGARQLGRDDLGRLAPGAAADLTLVRLDTIHASPMPDPAAALLYSASAADVHTVIVAGRVLLDAGRVPGVDEGTLLRECQEAARRLCRRAGVPAYAENRR